MVKKIKTPAWVVKQVIAKKNYTLHLIFADGKKAVYNAKPLLNEPLFEKLKDINFFLKAKIEGPSVAWDDDTDIAPEHLYETSKPL